MNRKVLLSLVLLIFVFTSCQQSTTSSTNSEQVALGKREAVLSVIHSRKSVRHFIPDKPVSSSDVETLLKAAMAAPTGVNKQPWHFMVITERSLLDSLTILPYAKMLKQAPLAIVVCGDSTIKTTEKINSISLWEYDCSLAAGNILLAAESMDLGAVWTAVHPIPNNIDIVRRLLKLPDNIIPLCLIPIGYPTGEDKPKEKFKPERIHTNNW